MDETVIKEITGSEIPGFWECLDSVARERHFLAQIEAPPLGAVQDFVQAARERGDIRVVALDGPTVVGWCDITAHSWIGLDHVGELGMGVLKACRQRGIGRKLLKDALSRARTRPLEKVELEVFASNKAAIQLYEKEGFVLEGRKEKSRYLDGRYDDILVMGRFL